MREIFEFLEILALESWIQLKESGIPLFLTIGIRNQSYTRNPESIT